jgi:hypothetical protein
VKQTTRLQQEIVVHEFEKKGSIATMDIHVEMKFGSSYFLQNFLFGFIAVIYMTTIERLADCCS